MDHPKVSVIIPNYNHAAYLAQRIESVLNQSFQNFEVIILDDCSTDNSQAIIDRYLGHPKIAEIVYNEQNSGSTFKQWEKGIAKARGELIWIAESDDWCETTLLEELVGGINKTENTVISYCQSYCIRNANLIQWQSQHRYLSETIDGKDFIKTYMVKNNSIFNASMVLWKKALFESVPKEFLSYKFCGDWLFWVELARLGDVHVSGRLLNYFRKHDNDVSGKAYQSGLVYIENLKVLNMMYYKDLIGDPEYNRSFKHLHKTYWKQRSSIDPGFRKTIKGLFKKPASAKASYVRVVLSGIWQRIKH